MNLNLIVACDSKYGISKNNSIPWKIKADMDYFNSITTESKTSYKNIVIYGKNTWLSLKTGILKNRINIVLSESVKQSGFVCDNLFFEKSLDTALDNISKNLYGNFNKVFICGGKRLYEESIAKDLIKTFYINIIEHNYDCDVILNSQLMEKCLLKCNKPEQYEFKDSIANKTVKMKFYDNVR